MIQLDALLLIVIGVVLGSVLGTEYASWRMTRRLKKTLLRFVGLKPEEWNRMSEDQKIDVVASSIKELWQSLFPEPKLPKPKPSRIVTLTGNEFFIPRCPKCGYAASPILKPPAGVIVEGECPQHGVFRVKVPKDREEEEE